MCKAYVSASTNPLTGTGQKASEFWRQIKEKFDELYVSEGVQEEGGREMRDQEALGNRFKRHIQRKVNIFNKYYKQVKQEGPSGTPESEKIALACERHLNEEGRPFLFKECVPILSVMPKFDPMADYNDSDDEEEVIEIVDDDTSVTGGAAKPAAINTVGAPMGHGKARPPGAKRAKEAVKADTVDAKKVKAMERLADNHEELASALKKNNQLQEQKNQQDNLYKQFEMYRALGNLPMAQQVMIQMQQLQQVQTTTPSSLGRSSPGTPAYASASLPGLGSASTASTPAEALLRQQSGGHETPV